MGQSGSHALKFASESSSDVEGRAWGALMGCALGDAMGMPTEMMSRADIRRLFPTGVCALGPSTDLDSFGRSMQAGEVTDDTENAALVARMLIESGGAIDARRYVAFLQGWMDKNPEKARFVAGPSTTRALEAIKGGTSLDRSGIFGTTNGGAMKIAPVGVVYDWHDLSGLVDAVEQLCRPTHNTGVAIACASAVTAAVSYGVRGGNDLDELWGFAMDAASQGEQRGYAFPCAGLTERMCAVRRDVLDLPATEMIERLQTFYGTGVESVETGPAVFAIVTLAGADPWKAACLSASIGGDTDTIGAIACAICGAMHPELIPADAAEQIGSANAIDFDGLARGLSEIAR